MISLVLAVLASQETLEPARHPWMAWNPGTSARFRIEVEFGATRQEGGVSYTLAASGAQGCTLNVVASQFGKEIQSEQTDGLPARSGAETLAIEGKEFATTAWTSRGLRGGLTCETRLWLRAEGGAPLKMTSKIAGQEDLTLTASALEDVVKAAGREFRCVRLEGLDALKKHQVTAWFCSDVPGGLVKMVSRGKVNGQALVSTLELVEIVEKK